jgi:aminoglycoside 6'-N-acetyltransferase
MRCFGYRCRMAPRDHDHPVLLEGEISVRPATADDLDTLAKWFVEPDNYRWWGGIPKRREEVAEKYIGRRCPRVESFLIELSDKPIGYIQYHVEGPGRAGLDMMLTPTWRDRGIGPRAARLLIRHLVLDRGWTDITVDPAADNNRAIRAWDKAGFTIDREWPDHPDGPAILMRLRPQEEAAD